MTLNRINVDPSIMTGKPCIKGTRVTVGALVGQMAVGSTIDEILKDFPYLEHEDILQALQFAAYRVDEQEIALHA
ncbi:MAG: hypothetical protein CVV51_04285 [Spirochaetae bacterium HGW-Spirochaetae-7]|nr:MAG: hypothetical protein CVV51_04285 [Spirochaetae bacterium HGW-Spirochaetae-7]